MGCATDTREDYPAAGDYRTRYRDTHVFDILVLRVERDAVPERKQVLLKGETPRKRLAIPMYRGTVV